MKKEILLNWIEALKSGEYQFARGHLRFGNKYCPLGVLCDISDQGKWVLNPYCDEEYEYLGEVKYLPEDVAKWSGMNDKEKNIVPFVVMSIFDQGASIDKIIKHLEIGYKIKKTEEK